eukprot:jgi/Mesvir1/18582/Mv17091-RA.1
MADVHDFGARMMRKASRREESDVIKAITCICKSNDIPRPFLKYTEAVRDTVAELGRDDYWICDFTPGIHCLLALVRIRGGRTACCLVHWDKTVYIVRMPPFKTRLFKGTVLQGVLTKDGLKTTFATHDCLAFARKSLLDLPFQERMEAARDVVVTARFLSL